MSGAPLFHVVMTRDGGSFPVSVLRVARGAVVMQESDGGIDALAWQGDVAADVILDAVSFARGWSDVHQDDVSAFLFVRVPHAYDRYVSGGVGELAHVGEIDVDGDGDVTLSVSDSRVWDVLNGAAVRFV